MILTKNKFLLTKYLTFVTLKTKGGFMEVEERGIIPTSVFLIVISILLGFTLVSVLLFCFNVIQLFVLICLLVVLIGFAIYFPLSYRKISKQVIINGQVEEQILFLLSGTPIKKIMRSEIKSETTEIKYNHKVIVYTLNNEKVIKFCTLQKIKPRYYQTLTKEQILQSAYCWDCLVDDAFRDDIQNKDLNLLPYIYLCNINNEAYNGGIPQIFVNLNYNFKEVFELTKPIIPEEAQKCLVESYDVFLALDEEFAKKHQNEPCDFERFKQRYNHIFRNKSELNTKLDELTTTYYKYIKKIDKIMEKFAKKYYLKLWNEFNKK